MIAYFDCFSGISGDMSVGALLDLGTPLDWLEEQLRALPLDNFQLTASKVSLSGIQATDFLVRDDQNTTARDYSTIQSLITASPLSTDVRDMSLDIFRRIAEAESKIHGCPIDHVHFHEVGGIDAIVDIVGFSLCISYLGITRLCASPLPLGSGFVKCSHGTLPVPAPATVEILTGIPTYGTDTAMELVTPTGAAIIASAADSFATMPPMLIRKCGYGAGKNQSSSHPNLLRVFLGEPSQINANKASIIQIEASIDDMNPEIFGYVMDLLFDSGALDVYWIPVYMKKKRPGTLIHVLALPDHQEKLIHVLLSETTTTGVRYHKVSRRVLPRETIRVETRFGRVSAKKISDPEGGYRIVPEYEVCKRLARKNNLPLREVFDRISRDANP